MKHQILVLNTETGQAYRLTGFDDEAALEVFKSHVAVFTPGSTYPEITRGRPSRKVRVVSVIAGEDAAANFQPGMIFDSASAASTALGYSFNAIGPVLRLARAREESSAVLRGVEWQYVDEIEGRV